MIETLPSPLQARARSLLLLAPLVASCGSAPKPVVTAPRLVEPAISPTEELSPPPLTIESSNAAEPEALAFPERCAEGASNDVCSPPEEFTQELCGGYAKPALALKLFANGSPWTRAYLRGNVDAWHAGAHSARVTLKFDEEVIVLSHRTAKRGGIVISDEAPFEVIRLDGNCATLSSGELTLKRPPAPKYPVVPWRLLDVRVQKALESDPAVAEASNDLGIVCAEPTTACTKAGSKLTKAILDFMAHGGTIPTPAIRR